MCIKKKRAVQRHIGAGGVYISYTQNRIKPPKTDYIHHFILFNLYNTLDFFVYKVYTKNYKSSTFLIIRQNQKNMKNTKNNATKITSIRLPADKFFALQAVVAEAYKNGKIKRHSLAKYLIYIVEEKEKQRSQKLSPDEK